jgi:hypothetical protein
VQFELVVFEPYETLIPAFVTVIAYMKRLVQVAHQVNQEPKGLRSFDCARARIRQRLPVSLEFCDQAASRPAIASGDVAIGIQRDVHVVKGIRLRPLGLDLIRPRRRRGQALAAKNTANRLGRMWR